MIYIYKQSTRQYALNLLIITTLMLSACAKTSAAPGVPGQIVFYADPGTGRSQIYIEKEDGSDVRQLVKSDFADENPSLSPDGMVVVFNRTNSDGHDEAFEVNVDGTNLHQINPGGCVNPCLDLGVDGHAWSPDGSQIVYGRAVGDGSGNVVKVGWGMMNADGSNPHISWELTTVADDHTLGWSPDGKRFVFYRNDNISTPLRSAIFTLAIDGTDLRQVTPWALNAGDPDWSPDGTLIVFCSPLCGDLSYSEEQNIYTIHPDGTGLTQLTKHLGADTTGWNATFHPSWSPDGSQIVFSHGPSTNGHSDLFVMNRDGSGLHLLAHTAFVEENPNWGRSPTK